MSDSRAVRHEKMSQKVVRQQNWTREIKPGVAGRTAHAAVPECSHVLQVVCWTGSKTGSGRQTAAGAALENAHRYRERLLHGNASRCRQCTGCQPDLRWAAGHPPVAAQPRPAGPPSRSGRPPPRLPPVSCRRPGTTGRPASQWGQAALCSCVWDMVWAGCSRAGVRSPWRAEAIFI